MSFSTHRCQTFCQLSGVCNYFTYFPEAQMCRGFSACNLFTPITCGQKCFSSDATCKAGQECFRLARKHVPRCSGIVLE